MDDFQRVFAPYTGSRLSEMDSRCAVFCSAFSSSSCSTSFPSSSTVQKGFKVRSPRWFVSSPRAFFSRGSHQTTPSPGSKLYLLYVILIRHPARLGGKNICFKRFSSDSPLAWDQNIFALRGIKITVVGNIFAFDRIRRQSARIWFLTNALVIGLSIASQQI